MRNTIIERGPQGQFDNDLSDRWGIIAISFNPFQSKLHSATPMLRVAFQSLL